MVQMRLPWGMGCRSGESTLVYSNSGELEWLSVKVQEFVFRGRVAQVDVTARNRQLCVYSQENASLKETDDERHDLPL